VKAARLSGCKNCVGVGERSLCSMRSLTLSQCKDLRMSAYIVSYRMIRLSSRSVTTLEQYNRTGSQASLSLCSP